MGKRVMLIGLLPEFVDYSKFPGLTPDRIRAGIAHSLEQLRALGYDPVSCQVDDGATAEAVVIETLAKAQPDCVVVGAGVRTDLAHTLLFEKIINAVHRGAPQAAIAFNVSPDTTPQAVARWVQPESPTS